VSRRRPRITLAFDEGPGIGLGHHRRMEALQHELDAREFRCTKVSLGESSMVAGSIAVIDSYRMRADDPGRVKAGVVIAIDDIARDLDVDMVVDPAPGATAEVHVRARRVLAGAPYALASIPSSIDPVAVDGPVERVLVTTGAADADGVGARLAAAVAAALPGAVVRLVVGPWGARDVPPGVVAVHARHGLAGEFAAVPIAVTAGGVSLFEACLLGRAVVAVEIADNQRPAMTGLGVIGAIETATEATAGEVVRAIAADPGRRAALGAAASAALDGKGPARVADAIEELVG
jgi:spore coat polysaccharide biosynthesis predicted glycosyltransferase SpsG